jgi:hypothetical protein
MDLFTPHSVLRERRAAAAQQDQRVQDAEGLGLLARSTGQDTTAGLGMGVADMLQSSMGVPGAQALIDQNNPALQDQLMAEASLLQGERSLKNEVDVAKENRARTGEARAQQTFDMNIAEGDRAAQSQLQNAARDIAVVQDYSTMLKEVGTETFKTQDRGILGAQRFQMLDMIRRTTEAGALQQAEIELFNAIIPEYDEWIKLTTGEREGKLQQFEYWMKTKAQDKALAAGLTYADIPELGRTYQQMTRPLPDGFQSGM